MEIRHLRYFLAVANELHFTRAAEKLGIGQPPLSQQIQQLERILGVTLFLRGRRGVELTEAGQAFKESAQQLLEDAERAQEKVRRIANQEIDHLTIGFTVSASIHPFVPRVIQACRKLFPRVSISLQENSTNTLVQAVQDKHIDLAFVRAPAPSMSDVQVDTLLHEDLMAVVPKEHALAQSNTISLLDLQHESFIFYPRQVGTGIFDAVIQACKSKGFTPTMGAEVPQMTSVITFVAAGMGVSLVPCTMQQLQAEGVCYIPLSDLPAPQTQLAIAYNRRALSPALSLFISRIREAAASYAY